MGFQWSLSDSKFPQVSRTLLRILADLSNAVVWAVSTRPVISKSSSPCINRLVTGSRSPITIDIIVTFMFHIFSIPKKWSRYLFLFSHSFSFTLWSHGVTKSTILKILAFLLIKIRSGHLAEIRWSVCISESHWSLCVAFFMTDSGLYIYHLFVWSDLNFLHNSLWIILPTKSCLLFVYWFVYSLRVSPSALADGLSVEFEW